MKKILFLTHYFPPEVNAPANRIYEHAIRWVKSGISVTVITNNPNHPHGKLFPGYKNKWQFFEIVDGIDVFRVKTFITPNKGKIKRSINFFMFMVRSIIASYKVKCFEVVLATSPQFFCGVAGAIIGKIRNKPFVLEIRDLWPDSITAVRALNKKFVLRILMKIEKWMYFSSYRIITLTDSFKDHVINYGYPSENIETISNGIDFNRLKITETVEKAFSRNGKFILSYIGTFGMAHHLETVLQAASQLHDNKEIHFLLIGDGAECEKLITLRTEMKLQNVTILPLQPKKLIPYFIKISDVGLIMLKNSELFKTVIPSKMFEYMAMKKPIITSIPKGEATDIVDKYNCGVNVLPENSEELSKSILFLYKNHSTRDVMGKNGLIAVKNDFNRDVLAHRFLTIIKTF